MICCKIMADYDKSDGKFGELYNNLADYGGVLWSDNSLFIGSDEKKLTVNKVKNILKKNNYDQFFIKEYHSIADVKESEYIRGWLFEWIVQINKKKYEDKQQDLLHNLSKGLDQLEEDLNSYDDECVGDSDDIETQKEE